MNIFNNIFKNELNNRSHNIMSLMQKKKKKKLTEMC